MSNIILTKHEHDKPKSELDNSFSFVKVLMIVALIVLIIGVGLWRISHPYDKTSISEVSTKATIVHHMNQIDKVKKQVEADIEDTNSKHDSITKWVSETGDEIHSLQDSVNNKEQQVKDLQNQLNN